MARARKPATTSETNSDPSGAASSAAIAAAKPITSFDFPERVEQTVKWLLTGARDADVVEAIRTNWPDQELPPLIQAAVDSLAKSASFEADVVRGWCFEATKQLYQSMTSIGDFAGALRAVKQLHEMAGR